MTWPARSRSSPSCRNCSPASGPVNWDLARQVAISSLTEGHATVAPGERVAVEEAIRLADLWLDDVTDLPSGVTAVEAWNRVEWVGAHAAGVGDLVRSGRRPRVATAMTSGLPEEMPCPGRADGPDA